MAATTEHLMERTAAQSPQEPEPRHPVLEFLNKINGLLMALAVAAWALLGNEYREKLEKLERGQTETVQILGGLKTSVDLLNKELAIRVESAREEHDSLEEVDTELERRLRQVEQDLARTRALDPKQR